MSNVERIIRKVNANMKIEGMELTDQDKNNIRKCYNKEITYDDMIEQISNKYSKLGK